MTFPQPDRDPHGKATVLKLSKRFEARYHIAAAIDRNLWLERDRFQPE